MSCHLWWKTREQFLPVFCWHSIRHQKDSHFSHKIPKKSTQKHFLPQKLGYWGAVSKFQSVIPIFWRWIWEPNPRKWKQDCISTNVNVLKRADMNFLWIDLGFFEQRKEKGALQRSEETRRNTQKCGSLVCKNCFRTGFLWLMRNQSIPLEFLGVARSECLRVSKLLEIVVEHGQDRNSGKARESLRLEVSKRPNFQTN